jgi:hypothetical protein
MSSFFRELGDDGDGLRGFELKDAPIHDRPLGTRT